jgi:signal transduction histidine kinase
VPYTRVADPVKLRRLLDAILMIEADIDLPILLRHIVEEARSLAGARYGALGVLNEQRSGLEQFLTVGLSDEDERVIGTRPTGRGVLGLLITEPQPLRLDALTSHPESYGFPAGHPPMSSFLGVPIRVRVNTEVYGNLYLTDKVGADTFNDEDEALVEALALAAGIAIENTRLQNRVRTLSVLDDRERIGRDLHDRVIQRLFAVGMGLQAAQRLSELDEVRDRVDRAIDDVDATISEIRSTIFELGENALGGGVRQSVLSIANEMTTSLGSRPNVTFVGAVDNLIPPRVVDHLVAVIREALTNAARHAQASRFVVRVVAGDDLVVEVIDNGVGVDLSDTSERQGLGLTNLRSRAEKLSGTLNLETVAGGGTKLTWRVPLASSDDRSQ